MEAQMVEKSHTAGWWPNLYEPLRDIGHKVADWFAPRSEASALQDYYEINIELPGVKLEDVDVSVHDNSLLVHGEKRFEREEKGRSYFFSEREYGAFQRSFRLPADANSSQIDAAFNDGVLQIKIAKQAPSQSAGKKIEVRRS
jgi:HSP20 family protein